MFITVHSDVQAYFSLVLFATIVRKENDISQDEPLLSTSGIKFSEQIVFCDDIL